MERHHVVVHPLDDAPSLEIRHFCDSGMKCFGEHGLFQQLASFLHRNTAVKLYSSGKTFKSLVKRKFSGLLLRLAMTSAFEEHHVRKLRCFKSIPLRISNAQELIHIMHELSRVLQNGLNLHRREPGAAMLHERYRLHQSDMRGIFHQSDISSSSVFIGPTWHLNLPKVGILMVTRKLFVNAARKRTRNFGYSERRWLSADVLPADVSPETLDRLGLGDPVHHLWWVQRVDRF